jgi:hypothetical protein
VIVWSVLDIVALIAVLAGCLYQIGTLLTRVATALEECAELVRAIDANARVIGPGVDHINQTGGVVAGALPLLYGMAEEIVGSGGTGRPPEPARAASGARRSRLLRAVGFISLSITTEPAPSLVVAPLKFAHHDVQRRGGIRARFDPVAKGARQFGELVRLVWLLPRFQQRPREPSLRRLVEV